MKVRIFTGFVIGVVLCLSLLFLPHVAVAVAFAIACALASFEILIALKHKYSKPAGTLCCIEIIMLILATATVFASVDNLMMGYVVILCALVDVGGYTAGKLAGKKGHKVSFLKTVSPNKTWEGYICGIICCIAFGYLIYLPMKQYLPDNAYIFSFFAWAPAIAGDLFESKIKRTLKVSDSGECAAKYSNKLIKAVEKPISSHGGYLDRIDSFTFAIVAFEIFLALMP